MRDVLVTREYLERVLGQVERAVGRCECRDCRAERVVYLETCTLLGIEPELV